MCTARVAEWGGPPWNSLLVPTAPEAEPTLAHLDALHFLPKLLELAPTLAHAFQASLNLGLQLAIRDGRHCMRNEVLCWLVCPTIMCLLSWRQCL